LTRKGEIGEEKEAGARDIETGMDIFGLNYGLNAETAMDQIAKGWTGMGTVLGGQQAGYQKWGQQMSMADIERMVSEMMGYGSQAAGVLGGNPAQRSYDPSMGEQLWNVGTDMLPYAAMLLMAGCWVAKEIFGSWEHPKTIQARYYINNLAPKWFKNFYLKYGEGIAKFIHNKPILKIALRPLFEYFAYRGKISYSLA
jgi:hypothetical protein